METPPSTPIWVEHPGHVAQAQALSLAFSRALGFREIDCEEIALAVQELASNLVKHAGGGVVSLSSALDEGRKGIQIESTDQGPGIPDPEQALSDGFSTAGSLGIGLGAVHRLMDDLQFSAPNAGGTRVTCRRWLRTQGESRPARYLEFGVATRPRRNETENGDAFVVRSWDRHALAGVIDGLGHGEPAKSAAQRARQYIEAHFDLPLERLFLETDRACRATRGVVMALASFDLSARTFCFASVGNIEARLLSSSDRANFTVRRGILGLSAPAPVVTTHPWETGSVLVVHSDGLHTHWRCDEFPEDVWESPETAARILLENHAREEDDATVLVVRSVKDAS